MSMYLTPEPRAQLGISKLAYYTVLLCQCKRCWCFSIQNFKIEKGATAPFKINILIISLISIREPLSAVPLAVVREQFVLQKHRLAPGV